MKTKYSRSLQDSVNSMFDEGYSMSRIGEKHGLSRDQVRHIRRQTEKGFVYPEDPILKTEAEAVDSGEIKTDKSLYFDDDYVYNKDGDVYVTFIPGLPKPLAIAGDTHRSMKRAYSDWDGQPATINQICRDFGMSRQTFVRYKRIHGWTHDSEPFTDEEVMERDVSDMVDEALQMRKQALWQRYEKTKWSETKKAAEKWNRFEQSILLPLNQMMDGFAPLSLSFDMQEQTNQVMGVWSLFCDLHYGKYGWRGEVGQTYNRKIAAKRVVQSLRKVIPLVKGKISMLVIPVGSDDEHIDTYSGKTSGGTEQDMDGTPAQIVYEYGKLLVSVIESLLETLKVPIVIVNVPGNHNRHTAVLRMQFIDAYFRNIDEVSVLNVASTRAYIKFGKNLVGFAHGDSAKLKDLPMIMASEKPEEWSACNSRVWITNHRHRDMEMTPNTSGARVFISPSLSGEDRWHYRKGFVNKRPSSGVYLFHKDSGYVGNYMIEVP